MSETPAEPAPTTPPPAAAPASPTPSTPPPPDAAGRPPKPKKEDDKQGLWKGWIRPFLVVILVVTALRSSLLDWNDVPTGSMRHTIAVGDRIVVNKLSYGLNPPFNGPKISIPFVGVELTNPLDFLPGFYWSSPKRNDIVTFWKPSTETQLYAEYRRRGADERQASDLAAQHDGGTRMIKRVVAVGGDVVEMQPAVIDHGGKAYRYSTLTINGETATYRWDGDALIESLRGDEREVRYIRNRDIRVLDEMKNREPEPWALSFGPFTVPDGQCLMIGDNRDNSADGRFFGAVELSQITGKAKFVAASFNGGFLKPVWRRFFKSLNR